MEWLDYRKVVPSDVRLQMWLAFGFLLVCLVNTVGLLLAKFLRRCSEIGVRRALGASRRAIFAQCLVEAGTVGLAGGVLGLGLALLGLWAVRQQPAGYADLAHLDRRCSLTTFALAIAASLLAGLLPAWRACQVDARPPAQVAVRASTMEIRPILSTLRRHKTAASLIVLEIALSCAIVCNALFLIGERLRAHARAPAASPRQQLVRMQRRRHRHRRQRRCARPQTRPGRAARAARREVARRRPTRSPFGNSVVEQRASTSTKDQTHQNLNAAIYMGDADLARRRWALKLVAGRDFTPDEFVDYDDDRQAEQQGAAARRDHHARHGREAVARARTRSASSSTAGATSRSRVVGVVEHLVRPNQQRRPASIEYAMILPVRVPYTVGGNYMLRVDDPTRARRGRWTRPRRRCSPTVDQPPDRSRSKTFDEMRSEFFRDDRAMAWLLVGVCVALLIVTALGIVGLASFWVQQRTRQIGVRRALGATRGRHPALLPDRELPDRHARHRARHGAGLRHQPAADGQATSCRACRSLYLPSVPRVLWAARPARGSARRGAPRGAAGGGDAIGLTRRRRRGIPQRT